jgi:hypothetical protein
MLEQRHVVPRPDGRWDVIARPGGTAARDVTPRGRAASRHATREQACDRAREMLRLAGGGELVIYEADGQVCLRHAIGSGHELQPDSSEPASAGHRGPGHAPQ